MTAATSLTFDSVYQKFHGPIHRYLARLVGNELADDLTQEVFISVNKNLPALNEPALLKPWIYRIASRHAADWFRRRRLPEIPLSGMEPDKAWEEGSFNEPDPHENCHETIKTIDQEWAAREMRDCIQAYVNRLPAHYREVIVLSEFEGFKNREIAEILDLSLDTVKIRLHRARTSLKQAFQSGCNLYYDESCEYTCEPKSP